MIQVVSLIGAALILAAFALLQWGRWQAQDWSYLWANTVGAGLLTAVAWLESQWGFLALEGVWALFSAWSLLRKHNAA
ncbi:MAG: CBU_0592 family membrane protein [Nevskiales bacterium]